MTKTYAYIRVSTDEQTVENQRDMITGRGYVVDEWLSDQGVSGTKDWRSRDIAQAVDAAQNGDRIIVAELSRLGRSLKQVLEIIETCRIKNVEVVMVREGIVFSDNNPTTKLLISILGSLAEMERNLISERTKDALAFKRRNGVVLGRPIGAKTSKEKRKLASVSCAIKPLFRRGYSKSYAATILGVNRATLDRYIRDEGGSMLRVYEASVVKIRAHNLTIREVK